MSTLNSVASYNTLEAEMKALRELMAPIEAELRPMKIAIDGLYEKQRALREEMLKELKAANPTFVELARKHSVYSFYVDPENADDYREIVEDDGTLHITSGKLRACFIADQDMRKSEWNALARPIVKAFGFKWSDFN